MRMYFSQNKKGDVKIRHEFSAKRFVAEFIM